MPEAKTCRRWFLPENPIPVRGQEFATRRYFGIRGELRTISRYCLAVFVDPPPSFRLFAFRRLISAFEQRAIRRPADGKFVRLRRRVRRVLDNTWRNGTYRSGRDIEPEDMCLALISGLSCPKDQTRIVRCPIEQIERVTGALWHLDPARIGSSLNVHYQQDLVRVSFNIVEWLEAKLMRSDHSSRRENGKRATVWRDDQRQHPAKRKGRYSCEQSTIAGLRVDDGNLCLVVIDCICEAAAIAIGRINRGDASIAQTPSSIARSLQCARVLSKQRRILSGRHLHH
ncbi:hypothetical protein AX777_25285 [Sphingobium yanoikuyae]|uniref:Uncharacterized protein n=1 Tax=Sphingobium yanoikuyae TaxID=13690 RepID=A0A177JKL4_SPHYA|nr:hypothetical protein AX777_25285 [Sphingobium yanoikuyae]